MPWRKTVFHVSGIIRTHAVKRVVHVVNGPENREVCGTYETLNSSEYMWQCSPFAVPFTRAVLVFEPLRIVVYELIVVTPPPVEWHCGLATIYSSICCFNFELF